MTSEQAIQVLRQILNIPAIKLLLPTQDIALAEEALKVLTKPEKKPKP